VVDSARVDGGDWGDGRYEPDPEYSYSAEEFTAAGAGIRPAGASAAESGGDCNGAFVWAIGNKGGGARRSELGRKVRHPEYEWTVVGVEGDDDDRRVSVVFRGRTKKFVSGTPVAAGLKAPRSSN